MSSPLKEKNISPPSLSPGSHTPLLAGLPPHKPVLSSPHPKPALTSPLLPQKPLISPTPLPHKRLVSPQPHKPLVSPQFPAKAVCRLCGELYSSYVELWAHVTTSHASSTPLPRATSQTPTTTPTTILSNSALPYPLPILPLNLGFVNLDISLHYIGIMTID